MLTIVHCKGTTRKITLKSISLHIDVLHLKLVQMFLIKFSSSPITGHTKIMKLLLIGLKTKHNALVLRDHVIQFFT
jgi:hypothetical protein